MKVLIVGASGFVGMEVARQVLEAGLQMAASAHNEQSVGALIKIFPNVEIRKFDITNASACETAVRGVDAIIYLPGLLREYPSKGITFEGVHVDGVRNLLEAAKKSNVTRWLQMSALGARKDASTKYFQTKWKAEELVRTSGLDWTIFRPSVIFSERPNAQMNFVSELARVTKVAPVLPVFGDGTYRLQPIALREVASAFCQSLVKRETVGETYELGGPKQLTYNEIIQSISEAQGRKKPLIHIPFGLIETVALLLDRFRLFPVSRDQLAMLKEENIVRDPFEMEKTEAAFGVPSRSFEEGIKTYFQK